jgi:antitoxin FitA
MPCARNHAEHMGVLIPIRDVPDDVHRTLEAQSAASGQSMSEYLRALLARAASRPTPEELVLRIQGRGIAELGEPSEAMVRAIRDRGE